MPLKMEVGLDSNRLARRQAHYSQFQSAFKRSRRPSIDRFLQIRQEFADIGKQAICHHINKSETQDLIEYPDDCWISWLVDRLVTKHGLALRNWPVKFVTFNYDRVLEYFLAEMYTNVNKDQFGYTLKKIYEQLEIYHVYGKLVDEPDLLNSHAPTMNFGMGSMPLPELSGNIKVMGEERMQNWEDGVCLPAAEIVRSASTLIFLGFSFDETNCKAIGLGKDNELDRCINSWYSTGYGMKAREKNEAKIQTNPRIQFGDEDMSCLDFLRTFVSV
tara:strand:- start:68100 stop:68921 length:822 start_codon:yes stop_codon:yes gene_type:complete